jgi:hypothetical protein
MIAIIQCASSKRPDAGFLRRRDGTKVYFVADPTIAPPTDRYTYARPDDLSDTGATWRQVLLQYNSNSGNNPLGLCRAFELYGNDTYRRLVERFGTDKTYILSAGWGLINAAFLTPNYDITFSVAAKRKAPYKFRKKTDRYDDLCMLPADTAEPLAFFGGKDYVPFFCRLTQAVKGARTLFYNSSLSPNAPGCLLEKFSTTTRTNWHYECANAFLDGRINLPHA